jgi:glycine cleavage system aminomethyltransferase T
MPTMAMLDDCIVYRFEDHYMIVVNASNIDKDRDWIARYVPTDSAPWSSTARMIPV